MSSVIDLNIRDMYSAYRAKNSFPYHPALCTRNFRANGVVLALKFYSADRPCRMSAIGVTSCDTALYPGTFRRFDCPKLPGSIEHVQESYLSGIYTIFTITPI